ARLAGKQTAHDRRTGTARARNQRQHLRETNGKRIADAELVHAVVSPADKLRHQQQQPDDDHHRRDHPEVFRERSLDLFLQQQPERAHRKRTDDYQPAQPRVARESWLARRRAAAEPRQVIGNESARDVDDVGREVDEHGEQSAELNDGDRRGRLLGLKGLVDAAVQFKNAGGEDKMSSGTDGGEFGKALNEAEKESLKNGHPGYSRKEFLAAIQSYTDGGMIRPERTIVASCQGNA